MTPLSDSHPSITVLILNWNGRALLPDCLEALLASDYPNFRVVVVDNGSEDDSVHFVETTFPDVQVMALPANLGFSRAYNVAFDRSGNQDALALFLNNDVVVRTDWLSQMVKPFEDPTVGIVGCKLLYPDGQHIQHAGAELTYPVGYSNHFFHHEIDSGQADAEKDVPYVTGAALAIRWSLAREMGPFDEDFSPFYLEEVDLCYRVRDAGFRVLYTPSAVAVHHEAYSTGKRKELIHYTYQRNRLRFIIKHYTDRQFLDDFIPAEKERLIQTPTSDEELSMFRRVYFETSQSLQGDAPTSAAIRAALNDLWLTTLTIEPVRMPGFIMGVPIVEPAFAAALRLWNKFLTHFLLWPLIRRQEATNQLLSRLVFSGLKIDGEQASNLADDIVSLSQQKHQRVDEQDEEDSRPDDFGRESGKSQDSLKPTTFNESSLD